MKIQMREYRAGDVLAAISIWNEVVEEENAFPQMEKLTKSSGQELFLCQLRTEVAYDVETGKIIGLFILHPNNVGHCGHICNASYAVSSKMRGNHVGELLVRESMKAGKELGFEILQFNAVVKTNEVAMHLYQKLGFTALGTIKDGFKKTDGTYEDIVPFYHKL